MSKKNYESDVTLFLKQLKKDKPDLQAKQVAGRARLWFIKQNNTCQQYRTS